jgi:Ca2+/H+ antiporter
MLKEIKCEQKLFVFVTYLYVTFSLLYIGKKVYDNETREDSFPFNIGYFIAILLIHLKAYGYVLTKIQEKAYGETMKYFGWMFMLMAITIVMTCTVGGYDGTYYQKIADINTLVSTLIYQFIVLYVVFIRISLKMDKKMTEYKYDQHYRADQSNVPSTDGSVLGLYPVGMV